MSTKLNRDAYQKLVDENIAWLGKQPKTLERDHSIDIVRSSVRFHYDADAQLAESAAREAALQKEPEQAKGAHRHSESIVFVNAYPDEDYPRRILQAHLDMNSSSYLTDNLSGRDPSSPLCIEMNKTQVERCEILRAAIDALAAVAAARAGTP